MSNDDCTSLLGVGCIGVVLILFRLQDGQEPPLPITIPVVSLFLWIGFLLLFAKPWRQCDDPRERRHLDETFEQYGSISTAYRQRDEEISDHNPQEPTHARSNLIAEARSSYFDQGHKNRLKTVELDRVIPSGIIIKSNNGNQIWADFENGSEESEDLAVLNDDHCIICLLEWQTGDRIRCPKNCSHIFHSDCLLSWMNESNECPSCRACVIPLRRVNETGQ